MLQTSYQLGDETTPPAPFNIAPFLAQEPFARFLRVHTEHEVRHFPLEPVAYNCNLGRGNLHANYRAVLEANDLNGQTITGLALSRNGNDDINLTSVNPVEKTAGYEVVISVFLSLTLETENCAFIHSDENPLIRAFLGLNGLDSNRVFAHWGESQVGSSIGYSQTIHATQNRLPFGMLIQSDGLHFFHAALPAIMRDVVVFIHDEPVLRVSLFPFVQSVSTIARNPTPELTLGANRTLVFASSNATQGVQTLIDVAVHNVPRRFLRGRPVLFDFDPTARIISSPCYNSAAFVTERQAYLLGERNGRVDILASLDLNDARGVHMPTANEILLLFQHWLELYRYEPENGGFRLIRRGFIDDAGVIRGPSAAIKFGNNYSFIRQATASRFDRFFVSPITIMRVQSHTSFDAFPWRNREFLGLRMGNNHHSWNDSSIQTRLRDIANSFFQSFPNMRLISALDGLMHCFDENQPDYNCVVSAFSGKIFLVSERSEVTLCGDYFVAKHPSGLRELFYFYRDQQHLVQRMLPDMNTVKAVQEMGNFLLVLRDNGTLEEYIIEPEHSYLYHRLINPAGTIVSAHVRNSAGIATRTRRLDMWVR
ncbi:MAG: hypothetical protein FWC82_00030 [Firmicutes bacterium]|nr:hypothetical protein [Bacillota bacterium]